MIKTHLLQPVLVERGVGQRYGVYFQILTTPNFFIKPDDTKCSILSLKNIQNDNRFRFKREFSIWIKNGRIQKKSNSITDPSILMGAIQ
jgi:hypothetical protein